jgi:RND family efflux transporter MFP subunit
LTKTITDANAIRAAKLQNNLYEAEKDLADYNYKILNAAELGLSAEAVQTYMGYAQNKEKLISSIQYELNALSNSEKAYNDQKALAEAQNVLSDYKAEVEKAKAEIEAYEGVVGNKYDAENILLNGELSTMRTEQSYQDLLACDGGVKAEFDGVISQCGIEAGAKTTAGTVMITLASLDDVKVSFGVTKSKLADVKIGQKAVVTVMDKEYEGTVSRIDSMATVGSNGSSSIMVDIHIDNPDNDIYLGLDARIELCTASKSDVVMLPVEAVSADKEGEFVYTVVDGIVVKKYVTLGISSDEYVEIVDGIEETDQVITMMSAEIEEGIPVMAMPQMDSAELEMMMEGM